MESLHSGLNTVFLAPNVFLQLAPVLDIVIAQWLPIFLTLLATYILSKILKFRNDLAAVGYTPGYRVFFGSLSLLGVLLPTTWWNPGFYSAWKWRHRFYKQFGTDTISFISVTGPPMLYTSNLEVARQVAGASLKSSFMKEVNSRGVLLWGMNLFAAAERDVWRKHRRAVQPAFNSALHTMVWQDTVTTYHEMIEHEDWTSRKTVDVPIVQQLAFKLALLILVKCGFGLSYNWFMDARSPDGKMTIQDALKLVTERYLDTVLLPRWVQRLPFQRLRETREAHDRLEQFMMDQVTERRDDLRSGSANERHDVFTMLIKSNEDEGSKYQLTNQEVIGNIYLMLIAGHETSARTIAAVLGLLSVHEEIQEDVYQQIHSVVGARRDPTLLDYPKLDKVLAVFYESLRMFPAAHVLVREAFEDTILQVPNPVGEEGSRSLPIPRGTQVLVDMVGLQYNPRYYTDPFSFKPSRWAEMGVIGSSSTPTSASSSSTNTSSGLPNLNAPDNEAFTAFSIGSRACIGRKFATLESVAFLTCLLRDWKVEPLLGEGETKEEWKDKVLQGAIMLTLGVRDLPVRLVRRQ